jgi:hypothetical protein
VIPEGLEMPGDAWEEMGGWKLEKSATDRTKVADFSYRSQVFNHPKGQKNYFGSKDRFPPSRSNRSRLAPCVPDMCKPAKYGKKMLKH